MYVVGERRSGRESPKSACCRASAPDTVQNDVVALGASRPESVDPTRFEQILGRDAEEQLVASSKSSRAAGCSRIAGKRPFIFHAWKKNCQSMYGRSSATEGSTNRTPVKAGVVTSCALQETGVLFARGREWEQGLAFLLGVERSQSLLLGAVPLIESVFRSPSSGCLPRRRPRRRHVIKESIPARSERRVLARRGGAADHERQCDPAALHLARHPTISSSEE